MDIYTIGHSTYTKEIILNKFSSVQIKVLADVRTFQASRNFPQYNRKALKKWLEVASIQYEHVSLLGGRRNKSQRIQEELNDA